MPQTAFRLADVAAGWCRITQTLVAIVDRVVAQSMPPAAWRRPSGEAVTDLELRIDIELRAFLARLAPELPVISEELGELTSLHSGRGSEVIAVLDPVDGTRNLLDEGEDWYCSLAVCEQGVPKLGIVYQPARRISHDSAHPQPLPSGAGGVVAVSPGAMRADPGLAERLQATGLRPMPVAHAVAKIVRVLDGRADAAVAPARIASPFFAWDLAAVMALADAHDLTLRTAAGAPLDLGDLHRPLYTGWICTRDQHTWTQVHYALTDTT